MSVRYVLHGGSALPHLLVQLILGTVVVGFADDLVVNARDYLLNHRAAVGACGGTGAGLRECKAGKHDGRERNGSGDTKDSQIHNSAHNWWSARSTLGIDVIVN